MGWRCKEWWGCEAWICGRQHLWVMFVMSVIYWHLTFSVNCTIHLQAHLRKPWQLCWNKVRVSTFISNVYLLRLWLETVGKIQYRQLWMQATVQAHKAQDRASSNPCEELRLYLEAPLELIDDVVAWWGGSHYFIVIWKSDWLRAANIASFHAISNPVLHGSRLSCNPRLCCPIWACLF